MPFYGLMPSVSVIIPTYNRACLLERAVRSVMEQTFHDLEAKMMIPMHYGSFKLSFEDLAEPPRWLRELVKKEGIEEKVVFMDEGIPQVF